MSDIVSLSCGDFDRPVIRAGITSLCLQFGVESNYPAEFNPEHFFAQWKTMTRLGIAEFYVGLDSAGVPVGMLGASFIQDLFTGVKCGAELFWFVNPATRGASRLGLSLFNRFEARCSEVGCKMRLMAHLSGLNEGLSKLYKRRGYNPAEQFFRKVTV